MRPDRTLHVATVPTMPFARPRFEDVRPALDFVVENDDPARGAVERVDAPAAA